MNNLILGCANSLIAHQVYADFLEDSGKDTRFFRIFLQMRRCLYFNSYNRSEIGTGFNTDDGDGYMGADGDGYEDERLFHPNE